jgi:hypothetical protein
MKEDEIIAQVQNINSDMEALWKHEDNVVCIHPGWDLFTS